VSVICLPGLVATNPQSYLAALGVLDVLGDRARLSWSQSAEAEIIGDATVDEIVAAVVRDALASTSSPILAWSYSDGDGDGATKRDIKHPAADTEILLALADARSSREGRLARALVAVGGTMATRATAAAPTRLHMTSRNQQWIAIVDESRRAVDADNVRAAIVDDDGRTRLVSALGWDCLASRPRAYCASASDTEPRTQPAAQWLAYLGLAYHPTSLVPDEHATRAGQVRTTGVHGGWRDQVFTYPIWPWALTASEAAEVIEVAWLQRSPRVMVFASRIERDRWGGGRMSPGAPVVMQ
jgi:hypothetical protein